MKKTHRSKNKWRKKSASKGVIFSLLISALLLIVFVTKPYATFGKEVRERGTQLNLVKKVSVNVVEEETQSKEPERVPEKPAGKVVYLTFDDGPSQLTDQFLDLLQKYNVKATFFMQGTNLKKEGLAESVKRATEEGHYVGGHSMTHEFKTLYTEGQFVPEMNENLALIYEITGIHSNLVRPPYGSAPGLKSEKIRDEIAASGMKVWDWTIDSRDWELKNNPAQIVENIKNETNADIEVVLMHEKPQTLQVLPEIIAFFKEEGYEFGVYNEANHFNLNFQKDDRF